MRIYENILWGEHLAIFEMITENQKTYELIVEKAIILVSFKGK